MLAYAHLLFPLSTDVMAADLAPLLLQKHLMRSYTHQACKYPPLHSPNTKLPHTAAVKWPSDAPVQFLAMSTDVSS